MSPNSDLAQAPAPAPDQIDQCSAAQIPPEEVWVLCDLYD